MFFPYLIVWIAVLLCLSERLPCWGISHHTSQYLKTTRSLSSFCIFITKMTVKERIPKVTFDLPINFFLCNFPFIFGQTLFRVDSITRSLCKKWYLIDAIQYYNGIEGKSYIANLQSSNVTVKLTCGSAPRLRFKLNSNIIFLMKILGERSNSCRRTIFTLRGTVSIICFINNNLCLLNWKIFLYIKSLEMKDRLRKLDDSGQSPHSSWKNSERV